MKNQWVLCRDFLLSVVACFIIASLMHTQFVLHELVKLDVYISLETRLWASWQDIIGLLPAYGATVFVALLIAFVSVNLGIKAFKPSNIWRKVLFPLAGAAAIFAALMAMQPILNITLIAGARTSLGILAQCAAGAVGGWVFYYQRDAR